MEIYDKIPAEISELHPLQNIQNGANQICLSCLSEHSPNNAEWLDALIGSMPIILHFDWFKFHSRFPGL